MTIYKGKVERVRNSQVEGWVAGAGDPPELVLVIDDRPVASAVAGRPGADGRAAFRIAIPDSMRDDGVHKIAVKVKDAPAFLNAIPLISVLASPGDDDEPLPVAAQPVQNLAPARENPPQTAPEPAPEPIPELAPAPPPKLRRPGRGGAPVHLPDHMTGHMDGLDDTYVYGWIVDRDRPGPVELTLYIDNQPVHDDKADRFRQDVQAAGTSDGHSGFHFNIPNTFWFDRPHRIDVRLTSDPTKALFQPILAAVPASSVPAAAGDRTIKRPPSRRPVPLPANLTFRLKLEQLDASRISGWLINLQRQDLVAEADVYVDGIRAATVVADQERDDVLDAGLIQPRCGFEFRLFHPGREGPVRVQFAPRGTRDFFELDKDTVVFGPPPQPPLATAYPQQLYAGGEPAVVIHLPHPDLKQAVAQAGRADVILVKSDIQLAADCRMGMRMAAWSDPRAATATPLGHKDFVFSTAVVGEPLPAGFTPQDMARLVRRVAVGVWPRRPVGGNDCIYMRRDALDRIGFDGDIQDFCLRATRAGLIHIVDDRSYVPRAPGDAEPRPDLDTAYPELPVLMRRFAQDEAMQGVSWRIGQALIDPKPSKPRILYVISTRDGGTPQTNRDLMTAVGEHYEPWLLACDSRTLELIRFDAGRETVVETATLGAPIQPTLHRSAEYDDVIARWLLKYAFELVHIRHLGWHSADLPQVCHTLGVPVVLSFHDFYTICPTVKLLDQDKVYCAGKCTPTVGDCAVDLWPQNEFPQLKHGFVGRWREIFAETFSHCDAFVTTSPGARDLFRNTFPGLAEKTFPVIPHGRSFAGMNQVASRPGPETPVKILVPGNISPAKGSDRINEIIALDLDGQIEWHLLGDPGNVQSGPNVVVHGPYQREAFAEKAAAIAPHIGAVLSIWPETYCHTLTEMWACGLPVAGLDIGAVGERIAAHGGGWLFPVDISPDEALRQLLALRAGDRWEEQVSQVLRWQTTYAKVHDIHYMGAEYESLYKDVMNAMAR